MPAGTPPRPRSGRSPSRRPGMTFFRVFRPSVLSLSCVFFAQPKSTPPLSRHRVGAVDTQIVHINSFLGVNTEFQLCK